MSSHDLKEALSHRLKRMESGTNPSTCASSIRPAFSRGSSFTPTSGSLLNHNDFGKSLVFSPFSQVPQILQKSVLLPVCASQIPDIECEGYLAKYSSGSLTARWQRRYFVLRGGRFGYYKKQPVSLELKPDKTFSLRKIKSVFTKDPCPASEREFTLELGDHLYQLKASSPSEMRKWLSALSTALAQKDSFPELVDEEGASSGCDMMSVTNSVSSVSSNVSTMSEDVQLYLLHQRKLAAASSSETVWEVEVDVDQLDVLFKAWFPSPKEQVQMTIAEINKSIVAGLTKVVAHLYAILSNEVFDEHNIDLLSQFDRVKVSVDAVRKNMRTSVKSQLVSVVMEYIPRIIEIVDKFLEKRAARRSTEEDDDDGSDNASSVKDLPQLLGILALLIANLNTVWQEECSCVYCNNTSDGSAENCVISDKWRRALRSLQQRVASEFEVCLIETIQGDMLAMENTWDAAPSVSTGPAERCCEQSSTKLWLTGWTPSLLMSCQSRALTILDDSSIFFPKRLISELLSSLLVAVLNSAWRQFHRKSLKTNAYVQERKRAIVEAHDLVFANSGFWGLFAQTKLQVNQILKVPPEETNTLELCNLVSFANEAIILSTYSAEMSLPFVPRIFQSCFEGLGMTFVNSATETCAHLVSFFYLEKTELGGSMQLTIDLAEKFLDNFPGAHPNIRNLCLVHLPSAVVHAYVTSVIRQKNLKKLSLQADLFVFKSGLEKLGATQACISLAMVPLHWIFSFLTEPDVRILIDELAPKLAGFFGAKKASLAINTLMDMRGINRADRNAVMVKVLGNVKEIDNHWKFN